jgi:hypothetical protein
VCAVPDLFLQRTWRGDRRDRSGDIQLLPQEPNFVGHGGLPHSGPWDYISDVPLLWYGPGHIRAAGEIDRRVTLADMAPTTGELIDFPFDAPDGHVLHDARAGCRSAKLVVTVVWDGAGRDVLGAWPDDWPYLRSLINTARVRTPRWIVAAQHRPDPRDDGDRRVRSSPHRRAPLRIGGALTEPWTRGWIVDPADDR